MKTKIISFYLFLLCFLGIATWISQNSIEAYWQQTYHRNSPIWELNQYAWWTKGQVVQKRAEQTFEDLQQWLISQNEKWNNAIQPKKEITNEMLESEFANRLLNSLITIFEYQKKDIKTEMDITRLSKEINDKPLDINRQIIIEEIRPEEISEEVDLLSFIGQDGSVLFAGDSLMQGVAPHMQKYLNENFAMKTINLSKQSTGLSYPSFFDWPKTIEDTFKSQENIKLLIVFLGANDPWDFPNPSKPNAKYLPFQSEEWESIYRQRIKNIMTSAQKRNIVVIWIGIPYMRKPKLNEQVIYLNKLYETEANQYDNAIFFATDKLLSNNNAYSDRVDIDGKSIKVRSKDGIHFSLEGQKYIANYILQKIGLY